MALTFRSPAEEALTSFSSVEQSHICKAALDNFISIENKDHSYFNYALNVHAKERLTGAGVYLSPITPIPHSHPACKILENYMLYKVLPSLIDNSFTFVGIKDNKLTAFKSREPKLDMVTSINRYVTSHDKNRYFTWRAAKREVTDFSDIVTNSPTLKDLVPEVLQRKAKNIFLHDEIHYWSTKELLKFLEVAKPDRLLATMIFPPEILAGSQVSLNRWCYDYEIFECAPSLGNFSLNFRNPFYSKKQKKMLFFPDRVRSEGYEQPLDCGYLLKTKRIICEDGTIYCVDIVCTKFAHHMVSITRGNFVTRSTRTFGDFEAISMKGLSRVSAHVGDCYPIGYSTVNRIYRYLRSLVKPDVQSAVSKLSQTVSEPTGPEIKFVEEFSRLVIKTSSTSTIIQKDDFKILQGLVAGAFPRFIAQRFETYRALSVDEFIREMEPFTFTIKLQDLHNDSILEILFQDRGFTAELKDVVELMDEFTTGPTMRRLPQPYESLGSLGYIFEVPRGDLNPFFNCFTLSVFGYDWNLYSRNNFDFLFDNFKKVFENSPILRISFRRFDIEAAGMLYKRIRAGRRCIRYLYFQDCGSIWFLYRFKSCDGNFPRSRWVSRNTKYISQSSDPCPNLGLKVFGMWREVCAQVVKAHNDDHEANLRKLGAQGHEEAAEGVGSEGTPSTQEEAHPVHSQPQLVLAQRMPLSFEEMLSAPCAVLSSVNFGGLCINIYQMKECGPFEFNLPDRVGNRKAGWFNRGSPVPYRYSNISHDSLGWLDYFDRVLILNGLDVDYYDCVLAQEYDSCGRIGFHSDDEDIFLRDTSVATFSLRGFCEFGFKNQSGEVHFSVPPHSFFEMPKGFQVNNKHTVYNCQEGRISLTFRRLRNRGQSAAHSVNEDGIDTEVTDSLGDKATNGANFEGGPSMPHCQSTEGGPVVMEGDSQTRGGISELDSAGSESTEEISLEKLKVMGLAIKIEKCNQGEYAKRIGMKKSILRVDQGSVFRLFASELGVNEEYVKDKVEHFANVLDLPTQHEIQGIMDSLYLGSNFPWLLAISKMFSSCIIVYNSENQFITEIGSGHDTRIVVSEVSGGAEFDLLRNRNDCCIRAVAEALDRPLSQVVEAANRKLGTQFAEELESGEGLDLDLFERLLTEFGICGNCTGEVNEILNPHGKIQRFFFFEGYHVEHFKPACKFDEKKHPSLQNQEDLVDLAAPMGVPIGWKCLTGSGGRLKRTGIARTRQEKIDLKTLTRAMTKVTVSSSKSRFELIHKSMLDGNTGVLFDRNFDFKSDLANRNWEEWTCEVGLILGTYGCGKSSIFKKVVHCNPFAAIHIVSPRRSLAIEMEENIRTESTSGERASKTRVHTFEKFIKHALKRNFKAQIILIDEIQLYPPGYLDLVLSLIKPKSGELFVLGDPCQSDYDSLRDRLTFSEQKSDIETILSSIDYKYNYLSYRFVNENFVGRLDCEMERKFMCLNEPYLICNSIEECRGISEQYLQVFLVSSFEEKKIIRVEFGEVVEVLTFGESTGRNFKYGTVLVTGISQHVNEKRWVTALSRFSHNLNLLNLTGIGIESVCQFYTGRCLARFMTQEASPKVLLQNLPGRPRLQKGFMTRYGKDYQVKELKLQGDPWLKTMINLGQLEDFQDEEVQEIVSQVESTKTHVPLSYLESIRASWVHRFKAKEDREFKIKGLVTNQFTDEHSKNNGFKLSNAAERFAAIYPRHHSNDTATFLMGVRKRLRFSKPAQECAKLRESACFGPFMLREFLKRVPVKKPRNNMFFDKAIADFEDKKTSKSTATIANHSGRSNTDWRTDVGLVFMKAQNCTKYENRFRDAKAAQTIVCFHHIVLARFAPYIRYIEMKVNEVLPKNFYIHSGKGLEELNKWVVENNFNSNCTESDYEAFDASQDSYILAFEICLMEHLGLPKDLIEDYKYIKTHLGSKLGNLAIMRFSGEASTFLFNTLANMLFTFLKYDLNGTESICFAGDDMCANRRLRLKTEHETFLSKLKLKAKVDFTKSPTFCGWNLTPYGIYKRPELVFERLCISKENGNFKECLDNYAIELSFAYKLGEKAVGLMSCDAVSCYYQCIRIIVKWKHLLKSSIALDFVAQLA